MKEVAFVPQVIVLAQIGLVLFTVSVPLCLHLVKGSLVNNGLVGVLHDRPLGRREFPVRHPGIELRAPPALYHVAQVDGIAQNIFYRFLSPGLCFSVRKPLIPANAFLIAVAPRGEDTLCVEPAQDGADRFPLRRPAKDFFYDGGCFRINDDSVNVLRVTQVAVSGIRADKLSPPLLLPQDAPGFPGDVHGIFLVDQVPQGDVQCVPGVGGGAVVAVANGDKPNVQKREDPFQVVPGLNGVAAKPGEILYHNAVDFSRLNVGHHALEP